MYCCRAVEIPCPIRQTFPISLRQVRNFLSRGEDFIALAKKTIHPVRYIFFLFSKKHMLWILIRSALILISSTIMTLAFNFVLCVINN